MMLRQKKHRKTLTVAGKAHAKIVALPAAKKVTANKVLMPPLTEFNMRYLKERDNDPL